MALKALCEELDSHREAAVACIDWQVMRSIFLVNLDVSRGCETAWHQSQLLCTCQSGSLSRSLCACTVSVLWWIE